MKTFGLILILIFNTSYSGFTQNISISEQLINSTIQIISQKTVSGNGLSKVQQITGTGFYFTFKTSQGNIPVIITNRHVVEGMSGQTLNFKRAKSDGNPDYGKIEKAFLSKNDAKWIFHPDNSVDLALLPIAPILNHYSKQNKKIFYVSLDESLIPTDSIKNNLIAIEDILMIGYPFGLRDVVNDLPIVRRGITATPYYYNFNNKEEFLCDISVYPGSSGSPIMILNQQGYNDRKGNTTFGSRALFMGINYATFTNDFEGKVTPAQAFSDPDKTHTAIPYNIAIVIKSVRILDFKPILINLTR